MTRKIFYGAIVTMLFALGSTTTAQAFDLADDFDQPCMGGNGILASICNVVNDMHVFIHDLESDITSLTATQILQQAEIDGIQTDVTNLSIRVDVNDVDISSLQVQDIIHTDALDSLSTVQISQQTEIDNLQGDVTSNGSTITGQEITISSFEDAIAARYTVESTEIVAPFLNVQTLVSCNPGDIAMSGGWDLPIDSLLTGARHFQEVGGFNGWEFKINNDDPVNAHQITFKVVCLDLTP